MASGSFRVATVARVLLLSLQMAVLLLILLRTEWIITAVVISTGIIFSIFELIHYLENSNRQFSAFLLSVKNSDFTKYDADDKRGQTFSGLNQAFNVIVDEFHAVRIEKEEQYTFLQSVISNLNTAILSFDDTGEIKLINAAAHNMLGTADFNNLRHIQMTSPELFMHLSKGSNEIVEVSVNGERLKLLLRSTSFKLQGKEHRLVLITNVKTEIDRAETEAWEQLLRVLTHEIMNSVTPISSLSETIQQEFDKMVALQSFSDEDLKDLSQGLSVIKNRSAGLINFVHHYKSMIAPPAPEFTSVQVSDIFVRISLLTESYLKERGIHLLVTAPVRPLQIKADERMIEQVLLNLLHNAADALQSTVLPSITLAATERNDHIVLTITDNGPGINQELQDKIFIPFFTTKTEGSGIGLSLSKQMMHLHKGSISVNSTSGSGTTFNLYFPVL